MDRGAHKRDEKIDTLKFLLICVVVLGHVIMALDDGRIERATFHYIYSFHMPLFVFISGYFTHPGQLSEKSFRSAFRFLSLFLIFDLLMWFVNNSRELGIRSLLTPQYAMWYLLSMFYWRLCAMFIKREWLTMKVLAWVTVFSALIGFVPFFGEMFSFNRTLCFSCFFMAGMMARGTGFFHRASRLPWWSVVLGSVAIYLFMVCLYGSGLRYVYSGSYDGSILRFVERTGQMCFAVVLGLCFIRVSYLRWAAVFARLGSKSLFIYLYHTFIIIALPYVVRTLALPRDLGMSVVYTIAIIIVLSLLVRLRPLNAFLEYSLFDGLASWLFRKCQGCGMCGDRRDGSAD